MCFVFLQYSKSRKPNSMPPRWAKWATLVTSPVTPKASSTSPYPITIHLALMGNGKGMM